jgi:hypothetical protein
VFASDASNLTPGDTNGARDVFARDRQTGRTLRVSTDLGGGDADAPSDLPEISRDGRVVAFTSDASDLVAADRNGVWDAFIRELASGRTRRVSVDSAGIEGNRSSSDPQEGAGGMSLSADGRVAGFSSNATNLASDPTTGLSDINGVRDVFVRSELFAPSPLSAPKITGAAARGQTLSGARGTWAGTPEITFAYQWQRCDAAGASCLNIPGATGLQYTLGVDDVGRAMRLRVRAANDAATIWRTSTATSTVSAG